MWTCFLSYICKPNNVSMLCWAHVSDFCMYKHHSASQPASQPASQSVSQPASQPAIQSASQPATTSKCMVTSEHVGDDVGYSMFSFLVCLLDLGTRNVTKQIPPPTPTQHPPFQKGKGSHDPCWLMGSPAFWLFWVPLGPLN